ncbi:QOR1_1 [Sanghuangporus weigelae]
MSSPNSAHALVLRKYLDSEVDSSVLKDSFALKESPLPSPLPDDSLLVKTLYLSNDPVQRLWMQNPGDQHSGKRQGTLSVQLEVPFDSFSLSEVRRVGGESDSIKVGDIVEGRTGWADYYVVKKDKVRVRSKVSGINLSAFLGSLGLSGATAYFALIELLKVKVSDTLVVSGAAGVVGNVAVQYAKKILGVKRVVGIAGSDEKCSWLKSIGADEALNYKSLTFTQDLAKATPAKIDKFFDNVGGPVLDEVMARLNPHAVVAVVGAISLYNKVDQPATIKNYVRLVLDRIAIIGFSLFDYIDRLAEAEQALTSAAVEGKLILDGTETVVDVHGDLEKIPHIWAGLFSGSNTGKLITKVADRKLLG